MYSALLIDDEPWVLMGIKNSVVWEDFEITSVTATDNPFEAMRIIMQAPPNVIISDICMPEITGLKLLETVNKHQIDTKVIFVTGFSEFSYAKEALNMGALALLLKPINPDDMKAALYKLHQALELKKKLSHFQINTNNRPGNKYQNKNFLDVLEYVETHFHEPLTLDFLAGCFYLNRTYISDLFKKYTQKSYSKYLLDLRVAHACTLMEVSRMNIQEIALLSGFKDYGNFCRSFKQVMDMTPTLFRSRI